jgi:hypothetical protein
MGGNVDFQLLETSAQDGFVVQEELAVLGGVFDVNHDAPQVVLIANAFVDPYPLNYTRLERDSVKSGNQVFASLVDFLLFDDAAIIIP